MSKKKKKKTVVFQQATFDHQGASGSGCPGLASSTAATCPSGASGRLDRCFKGFMLVEKCHEQSPIWMVNIWLIVIILP